MAEKLRLAVFKFASCDGCQLSLLDCEDELLAIADAVEIAFFLEARSQQLAGPYDVGLVEGSITTEHDLARIQEVRKSCKTLVTIGACATTGGIQALRNWANVDEFIQQVYAHPEYIATLKTSTPASQHVKVDFELHGCPISKLQLVETLSALVRGKKPQTPSHSVCVECKKRGTVCVAVAQGIPCLGPLTQAGCGDLHMNRGAICPACNRECFGCFGPQEQVNGQSLMNHYQEQGAKPLHLVQLSRSFTGYAPPFRATSEALESGEEAP
ncbi:oxidoreductase [Blastopirellula sp. JC732]|uniref:Oxidoreductase n=1 Tax=Blastopirellula sediminis TaxID=2894196 RepID=A0A9X1MNS8_9BACT|nr:oxidoreductase [Blastopirellula sediminis]MCC9608344.1 oxidoreductase [Blastopirellula sediminis]MCC9628879.1 oxidoreductase [Blastopirellula sediminis]